MLISRHHTTSFALALLLGSACAGNAFAQTQSQSQPARTVQTPQGVTVKAEGVALAELLTELAAMGSRIAIHLDPSERSIPVTVFVENIPVADAMFQVVRASGLDFVMNGRGLWAGRAKKAAEAAGRFEAPSEQPPPDMPVAMDATGAIVGPVESDPSADNFGEKVFAPIVPFSVRGDSVRVDLPNFIPYKLRPEAVKARRMIDITKIP